MIIYKGDSGFVTVPNLQNIQPGVAPVTVNDAVLSATLFDFCGNQVPGFTNIAGVYRVGSQGIYDFKFDGSVFNPETGINYNLLITGSAAGASYRVNVPVEIQEKVSGSET